MLRTIVIAVLLVITCGSKAKAQGFANGFTQRWQSTASPSYGYGPYGSYGYGGNGRYGYPGAFPSSGFGYIYDPYATGSFRAPDMHNDPYFQWQHKFDSRFPGRYSSGRPALEFRHPAQALDPRSR